MAERDYTRLLHRARGIAYYYDGTRWLSETRHTVTIPGSTAGYTATGFAMWLTVPNVAVYDLWITSIDLSFLVSGGTPLDASNKWDVQLLKYPAGSGVAAAWTIDSGSLSVWRDGGNKTVAALLGTTNYTFQVNYTKTGTPGTLFIASVNVNYRLVG